MSRGIDLHNMCKWPRLFIFFVATLVSENNHIEVDFLTRNGAPINVSRCCILLSLQIPYIETSAKDPPLNVDAAFHEVVRVIKYVHC